jgi:hypothetical protein
MAKQWSLWPLRSSWPSTSRAHGSNCGPRGAACFSGPERRRMGKAWRSYRPTRGSAEETRCRDVCFPFFTSPPRTDVTAPYRPYRPVMPYTSDFVVCPHPVRDPAGFGQVAFCEAVVLIVQRFPLRAVVACLSFHDCRILRFEVSSLGPTRSFNLQKAHAAHVAATETMLPDKI